MNLQVLSDFNRVSLLVPAYSYTTGIPVSPCSAVILTSRVTFPLRSTIRQVNQGSDTLQLHTFEAAVYVDLTGTNTPAVGLLCICARIHDLTVRFSFVLL